MKSVCTGTAVPVHWVAEAKRMPSVECSGDEVGHIAK